MQIIEVVVGPIESIAYIYYDENTKEAVLIDCGDEADKIIETIKSNGIKLKAILLTHGHFDHILACEEVKKEFNVPIYSGKNERTFLRDAEMNGSGSVGMKPLELKVDHEFEDKDIFEFSGNKIKVIFTPGHTFGSVCYYDEKAGNIFTGDTLFLKSVGRTDFPTGDFDQLENSIKKKIYALPDEVVVYPGHGPKTSIGFEKKNNPHIKG